MFLQVPIILLVGVCSQPAQQYSLHYLHVPTGPYMPTHFVQKMGIRKIFFFAMLQGIFFLLCL
jgi:hypothetical protein